MHKYDEIIFELVENEEYAFYKLVIDGKCQFEEFSEEVEKNKQDKKSLNSIISLMVSFSRGIMLPRAKFNHIKLPNINNVFEFKKDKLRVYVLKETDDMLIILGGYKAEQKKDIAKLQTIVKDYNNQRNNY